MGRAQGSLNATQRLRGISDDNFAATFGPRRGNDVTPGDSRDEVPAVIFLPVGWHQRSVKRDGVDGVRIRFKVVAGIHAGESAIFEFFLSAQDAAFRNVYEVLRERPFPADTNTALLDRGPLQAFLRANVFEVLVRPAPRGLVVSRFLRYSDRKYHDVIDDDASGSP